MLFFTQIEFFVFDSLWIYQCFILWLDCLGQFYKIMTVSTKFFLKHRVWQHCINIAHQSELNQIEQNFENNDELSCLFTSRISATRKWKLRQWKQHKFWEGIGYFPQIRQKSSASLSKQPTQLISSLRDITGAVQNIKIWVQKPCINL